MFGIFGQNEHGFMWLANVADDENTATVFDDFKGNPEYEEVFLIRLTDFRQGSLT